MAAKVETIQVSPFEGQKPGTSGLRKKVTEFQVANYTENFVQCTLSAALNKEVSGSTLVVGGDGRYFSTEAIDVIIKICAANGVRKLLVGQNGILSTPAVSCIIRKYSTSGGFILTASHNPGGPEGDFGIKFNVKNGGPAPENITNEIYKHTLEFTSYKICPDIQYDLSIIGSKDFEIENSGTFTVEVIDSVADYLELMKKIFDFQVLSNLIKGLGGAPPLKMLIDCMHGVTGPYAKRIFCEELGANENSVINATPLPDFGGHHPDPNLTYAANLVNAVKNGDYGFGAAFDGDGDRNMILGSDAFFVNPCDSLAILAANLECIPYFRETGVKGFARSMPTSMALDRVANATGKEINEVPTGWKFFGNLMDANRLSICGEESFGTGSDHIREKDGIWAVLAWLSVIAHKCENIDVIVAQHWVKYGRNYFTRYDYEDCDAESCSKMMAKLEHLVNTSALIGQVMSADAGSFEIVRADSFEYTDPIDGSVTTKQGIRIFFKGGERIIFRLSGTGSSGATFRIYAETFFESDACQLTLNPQNVLEPIIIIARILSDLEHFTGRVKPTVIT